MADHKQPDNPDTGRTTSSRTEEGAEHFKKATSAAADRAHEAIDHAEDSMHRGTDKVADAAERAAERATRAGRKGRGALDQVMDHANGWLDKTCGYVCEKPAQSLAMALVAGWLLGRLMRRR